ncbi:high mobility group B protein 6-like [Hibiscus syriacus]|nr:high mobility group B protein 6-like [Hibiscus syriacus]
MATARFHLSRRRPLHPFGNTATTNKAAATDRVLVSNPKMFNSDERNLNHQYPTAAVNMETVSLAEELNAFREKMERLRLDKEKTEKLLEEKDAVLLLQMKEIEERGQIQRHLEIQVDRLFRLKELKSYCMRISHSGKSNGVVGTLTSFIRW